MPQLLRGNSLGNLRSGYSPIQNGKFYISLILHNPQKWQLCDQFSNISWNSICDWHFSASLSSRTWLSQMRWDSLRILHSWWHKTCCSIEPSSMIDHFILEIWDVVSSTNNNKWFNLLTKWCQHVIKCTHVIFFSRMPLENRSDPVQPCY